ncbi:unnamed protein product [Symbiodinium microadriaticum]|nr:unnamed protein product [Symbiodinium microadriaticum]|mmetsp:Transcript_10695/g.25242  ORF Transcript_10695/g.25242 Transcript_10695/m.25242 type:complete len:276 (-) Transcript_10695:174-1001(-)
MIAAFALLTCLAHGASVDEHLPTALATDDQCALEGCAVNALQLRSKDIVEPDAALLSLDASEEELMEWHTNYYGRNPGADISVDNYRSLMLNISVQQKAILALWNRSVDLEKEVQELVQQVEHDSGLKVADYVALVEEADTSRDRAQGDNQPRETHVRKWLSYLDQEMGAVFRKLNPNGAKVAACGTLMSKNPVPLKMQKKKSLVQADPATTEPVMPGDHIGKADELWRSVFEIITNIHTADKSAINLKDHLQKINKMVVDFNAGILIPNEEPEK